MNKRDVIPIFPLPKVLFPRMILPLHIFEERYKEMIGWCRENNSHFGILHSDDVAEGAIGTTASIQRVLRTYDDGRLDLIVVGEERFRVRTFFQVHSYLSAEIEPLRDIESLASNSSKVAGMVTLFRSFIDRLGLEEKQREQLEELVVELELEREVSYVIAQTIGLDTEGQQQLLSQRSSEARIRILLHELKRHDLLHQRARSLFENSGFDPSMN